MNFDLKDLKVSPTYEIVLSVITVVCPFFTIQILLNYSAIAQSNIISSIVISAVIGSIVMATNSLAHVATSAIKKTAKADGGDEGIWYGIIVAFLLQLIMFWSIAGNIFIRKFLVHTKNENYSQGALRTFWVIEGVFLIYKTIVFIYRMVNAVKRSLMKK